MRSNKVQNFVVFKQLQVKPNSFRDFNPSVIKKSQDRLSETKFFDLIIDSQGIAIKKKKTDVLQRIQSFSLYPQENSVGVKMLSKLGDSIYKFKYESYEKAHMIWREFCESCQKNNLEGYTNFVLWLEENIINKN